MLFRSFEKFWQDSKTAPLVLGANDDARSVLRQPREEFCGGTVAELDQAMAGLGDMRAFYAARSRIESSDWIAKLREHLSEAMPVRRKRLGEEGEFQSERRFEPLRYVDRPAQASPLTSMEIVMDSAVRADITADALAQYCAMGWAVVDLLEAQGLSVGLTLRYWSSEVFSGNKSFKTEVRIKSPGEYLSPTFVAGFMSPNFYRRAVFMSRVFAADLASKVIDSGFGCAKQWQKQAEWSNGTLRLSPCVVQAPHQIPEAFAQAVTEANSAA